jgi:hypothetical protein
MCGGISDCKYIHEVNIVRMRLQCSNYSTRSFSWMVRNGVAHVESTKSFTDRCKAKVRPDDIEMETSNS